MAFKDSFRNSMQKALQNSFTIAIPQQAKPFSIEKSGLSIVPTYSEGNDRYGQDKGQSYEARLNNAVLRKMYERNVIVRAAVDTIINEVCAANWDIKVLTTDETLSEEKQKDQERRIKEIKNFFRHPNENRESFRIFLEKVMWDLLIYDAGCIEKVKTKSGKLKEMYSIAGDTVRVKIDKYGKILGYYQVIEGSKEDPIFFPNEQLIYIVMNPRSHTPYGFPILNTLENMVTAFLYGESYNIKYFENNATPRGILEMGDINEAQLDRFREYWKQENLQQPHRIMVVSNPNSREGKQGVKWIPLAMSSKDMELMQYMSWLMKMILMAFGVTPSEVGFADELRGAPGLGQALQSQAFKNKTIYPMMDRIASFLTEEIIVSEFNSPDLEFSFEEEKSLQEEMQAAQRDMILINAGIKTVEEVRKERGLKVEGEEGGKSNLDSILAGLTGGSPEEQEETIVLDSEESTEEANTVDLAYGQLKEAIMSALQGEDNQNQLLQNLQASNVEGAFKILQKEINNYLSQKQKGNTNLDLENSFKKLVKEIKFYLITKDLDNTLSSK